MNRNSVRKFGMIVVTIIAVGWTFAGLVAHGFALHGMWRQLKTSDFVDVQGTIEKSDVISRRTSKGGTSYSWSVRYRYEYGACGYASDRITFSMWKPGGAHELARRFPAGSAATVYVNRSEPAESVLIRGVSFEDFGPPSIAMAVCAGGIFMLRGLLIKRKPYPANTIVGLEVIDSPPLTGVSLSKLEPMLIGGLIGAPVGAACFLLSGAFGLISDVTVLGALILSWCMTFFVAVRMERWGRRLRLKPSKLMVFDGESQVIEIPSQTGANGRRAIPFDHVAEFVSFETLVRRAKGGPVPLHVVELKLTDGESIRVMDFESSERAEAFRNWCFQVLDTYQKTNKIEDSIG
ncbi:MAG: DUF3592 domain-containing protein [Phycisphaerales bacterium]